MKKSIKSSSATVKGAENNLPKLTFFGRLHGRKITSFIAKRANDDSLIGKLCKKITVWIETKWKAELELQPKSPEAKQTANTEKELQCDSVPRQHKVTRIRLELDWNQGPQMLTADDIGLEEIWGTSAPDTKEDSDVEQLILLDKLSNDILSRFGQDLGDTY